MLATDDLGLIMTSSDVPDATYFKNVTFTFGVMGLMSSDETFRGFIWFEGELPTVVCGR
jgi:hypothetical protein